MSVTPKPGPYLDSSTDPAVLHSRVLMMGDALGRVLVAAGMIRADHHGMSGPELLAAADTYCQAREAVDDDPERNFRLTADAPVQRSDGRYYVPVSREEHPALAGIAGGPPLLRVSTDSFMGDMDDKVDRAIEFACDLTARWNRGPC